MLDPSAQPEFTPAVPAARWDDAALLALAAITVADLLDAAALWRAMAPKPFKRIIDAEAIDTQINPLQAMPVAGGFIFNPETMRYYVGTERDSRQVADAKLKNAFLLFLLAVAEQYHADALQMLSGGVPLAEWQAGMAREVKRLHLASAMLGWGGMNQLPAAELVDNLDSVSSVQDLLEHSPLEADPVANTILYTLGRLGNFAAQIDARDATADTPEKVLDRAGIHRSGKPAAYAAAAHGTFEGARVRAAIGGGVMLQYRNVLHSQETCAPLDDPLSCTTQAAAGWSSVGSLVGIGARLCRFNCLCSWEFRRKPEAA